MSSCAYHPDRDVVGACVNCGKLVCAECKTTLGGKIYCNPCVEKEYSGATENTSGREQALRDAGKQAEQNAELAARERAEREAKEAQRVREAEKQARQEAELAAKERAERATEEAKRAREAERQARKVADEAEKQAKQEAELFTREKAKREANESQRTRQADELAKKEAEISAQDRLAAIPKEVRGWNWGAFLLKRTKSTWLKWGIGLLVGIVVVSVALFIANQEPKPAEFTVSDLVITPIEAEVWEEVTVAAKVTNIGEVEGNYTTTLRVDGAEVEAKEVTLAGETAETVTFTFSRDVGPSCDIEVDGLTKSLTIKEGVLPTLGIGDKWVWKGLQEGEEYERTLEVISKDIVDGKDCYVVELSMEPNTMGTLTIFSMSGKMDSETLLPLSQQLSAEMEGTALTLQIIYSYEFPGNPPYPLELGKEWQEIVTETTTTTVMDQAREEITTTTSNYKVERIEDITVPAGTFRSFKIVKYNEAGTAVKTSWYSDKVKGEVKPETEELISYSFTPELAVTPGPTDTTGPIPDDSTVDAPGQITEPTPTPVPPVPTITPPPDTTPPAAVTGLGVAHAYDGRVNMWWDKSTAEDFDRYNIYVSQSEITDTSGMGPVQQITDIATNTFLVVGLENGTEYYFTVTAVDKSDNENTQVTSASSIPAAMPRGTIDSEISIDVYKPDKSWAGTTLLADRHNSARTRIIEVNMLGEIVWEYVIPENLNPAGRLRGAGDVELLENNNILFEITFSGAYEINRNGEIVWSYLTDKISHDVDRLPNGNTLFVWGMEDMLNDAQVTEVNPEGEIVWTWYARDHFNEPPYSTIDFQGWTYTNAVTRMVNGNTLISPRNFGLLVEVDAEGEVVRTIGGGVIFDEPIDMRLKAYENTDPFSPQEPEVLPNGNILMVSQYSPHRAIEMVPETGEVVWEYTVLDPDNWPVRDADRLPNGNTLITGATKIVEVTAKGEIVWQLTLDVTFEGPASAALGFYKAERIDLSNLTP